SVEGARSSENGRGTGRLALCRREPFTILENRSGNRAQEGQCEILAAVPRNGEDGSEEWAGVQRPSPRGDGGILGGSEGDGREAALAGSERGADEAMSGEILVRKCEDLDDFRCCVELQRQIWGEADLEVEPATM